MTTDLDGPTPPGTDPVDVAVVGGGPAGWALAQRLGVRGLAVAVVDPSPARPWPATYGLWTDQRPAWLPTDVVAATLPDPTATARTTHHLGRSYGVLDTAALQGALTTAPDDAVPPRPVAGPAAGTRPRPDGTADLVLEGGNTLTARLVVDATGTRRALSALPLAGPRAAQTAYGLILPDAGPTAHAFMDWSTDHGDRPDAWPSFLYAVPVGVGRTLYEETSLARRPGLDLAVLRRRLRTRLAGRGIDVGDDAAVEHVGIVVDTPPTRGVGRTVAFGAAAGIIHPATGYSLATSLALADPVAEAITSHLHGDPAAAARSVIWSPEARAVHHLRRRGLEVLLALPAQGVIDFFETFFTLAPHHQHAYLTGRDDLPGTASAMWALFRAVDGPLRRHLVRHGAPLIGDVTSPPG